jgi:hypothetical protein
MGAVVNGSVVNLSSKTRTAISEQGYFEIYTENNHSEIYLDNLDFLYRYKLQPIENKYEDQILEMINKNNKISAFDLANLISKNPIKYGLISNCIWDLVCKEKLKTNLELSKITMNSLVELYYE